MKILIVEDDQQLCEILKTALIEQRHVVSTAADGQTGWDLAQAGGYDLILLDVMLPQLDGINLCRRLRAQRNQTLVLLMTAKNSSSDKAMGLDAGADDCVVKPIDLPELEARIRALLRRQTAALSPVLTWGHLHLDPSSCKVTYKDRPLNLTVKEYGLLELFLRNSQRIYSQSAILDQLWIDDLPNQDTVRAHIRRLRQKLKAVGTPDLIETVYGLGYRLNAAFRQPEPELAAQPVSRSTAQPDSDSWQNDLLWPHQAQVMARIKGLEQAIADTKLAAEQAQTSQQNLHQNLHQIQQDCHQLIGTLGALGLSIGAETARQMELLIQQARPNLPDFRVLQTTAAALRNLVETTQPASESAPTPSRLTSRLASQPAPQPTKLTQNRQMAQPVEQLPPHLLIVGSNEATNQLALAATTQNIQAAIASTPQLARDAINRVCPDLVVLDLSATPNLEYQAEAKLEVNLLLKELYQRTARIPVVVIIDNNSEIDRVTLARLGVRCILQKPSLDSLLTIVNRILSRTQTTEAKILILDDDLIVLKLLRALLETWGLQVTTLNNPAQLCSMLAAVQPDLLILDVQMPEVDGIELCCQLRDLADWAWLPIVFLTGSKDNETMQQIFSAGGDDYVTKPVVAPELITRILNRLDRTRLLRCQTEVDLLTQLPNRYRASQDLAQLLQQAEQHQRIFCLAVLKIEHLKQINYQFGHGMGDRLMRQIAQQLRQAFRPNDLVARWDGAKFVIGISDLSAAEGKTWLNLIKQNFQDIVQAELKMAAQTTNWETESSTTQTVETQYKLEYKIGTSQYPIDGTNLESLYRVAALRTEVVLD